MPRISKRKKASLPFVSVAFWESHPGHVHLDFQIDHIWE